MADVQPDPGAAASVEDRWIVSRLERLTARVTELYDGFRLSPAALELYGAFWSELCDWYLELAKPRLYADDNRTVSAVLLYGLERTLLLLHPVMPFVTEEIWSLLPARRGLLAIGPWPQTNAALLDEEAEAELGRLIGAVTALRRYRDEVGAKAGAPVRARLSADELHGLRDQIGRLARFEFVDSATADGEVLTSVPLPGGAAQVLRSDAFDPDEADKRVNARREHLGREIERLERKLANEQFVAKAPPEVVEAERRKLAEHRTALRDLAG